MKQELKQHEGINIPIKVGTEIWKIASDRHNFIFGKRVKTIRKKDKRETMEWDNSSVSYHSSLESVLKQVQKTLIKNQDIKTFEELHAAIRKTTDELLGMYEGLEGVL